MKVTIYNNTFYSFFLKKIKIFIMHTHTNKKVTNIIETWGVILQLCSEIAKCP